MTRDSNTPEDSKIIDWRMAKMIEAWWQMRASRGQRASSMLEDITTFVQHLRSDYIPTSLLPGSNSHDPKIDPDRRTATRSRRRPS